MSSIFALVFIAFFSSAQAKPCLLAGGEGLSRPVVQSMTAISYPTSLASGTLLPPSIAQGVHVNFPVWKGWGYSIEVDMATGFSEFRPSVQLLTGPNKKLADHFALGLTALYKFTPVYDGAESSTHSFGVTILPIVPTSFGSVSWPLTIVYNASTEDMVFVVGFKTGLKLN